MKVFVEIAFAGGVGPAGFKLDDPSRGRLSTGGILGVDEPFAPIDFAPWVDVTQDVDNESGFSVERGRSSEIEDYETTIGSLTLNNPDRTYDPTNEQSPFFPDVKPMRRVRVRAQPADGGDPIIVFLGFADDFEVRWADVNVSRVVASLDGLFTIIAGAELAEIEPAFGGEDSGARVRRVLELDEVDFPYPTVVDDGVSVLGDTTFGENALVYLQRVAKSEQGFLYESSAGQLVFKNRHSALSVSPAVVFTDDPDAFPGVHYSSASLNKMTDLLFTDIIARGVSDVEQRIRNEDAFIEFGARTLDLGELLLDDDDDVADLLSYLSFLYGGVFSFIKTITLEVHSLTPQEQRQVLALDIADRVSVRRLPVGGGAEIVDDLLVDGVSHDITGRSWEMTLTLASPTARGFLRLDDTVLGMLDRNVLAF